MYLAYTCFAIKSNTIKRFYFDTFNTASNQGSCYTSSAMKKLGVGEAEELVQSRS